MENRPAGLLLRVGSGEMPFRVVDGSINAE